MLRSRSEPVTTNHTIAYRGGLMKDWMKAWLLVAYWWARGPIDAVSYRNHLVTDPGCVRYRSPRPGSHLEHAARGLECEPCMVNRAFMFDDDAPWQGCEVPPVGWWCSREKGHDGPCAARPGTRSTENT